METRNIKPADTCRYDMISLGEVMLRFDPGDTMISHADSFKVWEGGGEYNVACALSRCFGMRTAVATVLTENEIGQLIKNRISAAGVDTSFIHWLPDDGMGESSRNSIYFLEKGFGIRPAAGSFDRGYSGISQVKPGGFDWETIFGKNGLRWFHTGGIMAGLSQSSADVIIEAMKIARKHNIIVSYDLNYRPSLWKRFGGKEKAEQVNSTILKHVDVLFGVESLEREAKGLETNLFCSAVAKAAQKHPNLKMIATTMRHVKTASVNDWSGLMWYGGEFYEGIRFKQLDIYDRVGGGDGFAAGVIYGMLTNKDPKTAIDCGVVHGALVMTTPGDNSINSFKDVDRMLAGAGAGAIR